jgi:hypothetical protein
MIMPVDCNGRPTHDETELALSFSDKYRAYYILDDGLFVLAVPHWERLTQNLKKWELSRVNQNSDLGKLCVM